MHPNPASTHNEYHSITVSQHLHKIRDQPRVHPSVPGMHTLRTTPRSADQFAIKRVNDKRRPRPAKAALVPTTRSSHAPHFCVYFARRSSLVIFGFGPFFPFRRGADALPPAPPFRCLPPAPSPPHDDAAPPPPSPFRSRSFFACFAALNGLRSGGGGRAGNIVSALADGTWPAAECRGSWDGWQLSASASVASKSERLYLCA